MKTNYTTRYAKKVDPVCCLGHMHETECTVACTAVGELQPFSIAVLAAAARGEIDLNALARQGLADRGLDWNGKWIGFPKKSLTLPKR